MTGQRADAQRNYARILAVAEEEVATHGADASLERIARIAGVGSATVRRHFPGRRALLQAVFRERVEVLCARAAELTGAHDARAALMAWLGALTSYAASSRGLADALALAEMDGAQVNDCSAKLTEAAAPLLRNAARAGAVTPGVTADDLLTLVTGIALATENHPDPASGAHRLLHLTMEGVSPVAMSTTVAP